MIKSIAIKKNVDLYNSNTLQIIENTSGVRAVGLIWYLKLVRPGRINKQLIHISDWLPTLVSVAGGNVSSLTIDGIDLWSKFKKDIDSRRKIILHNIDDFDNISSLMFGEWKLVKGSTYNGKWDNWYGPSGINLAYNVSEIINCLAGQALMSVGLKLTPESIKTLRRNATLMCSLKNNTLPYCKPNIDSCLFNVNRDPCETNNLSNLYPNIMKHLEDELQKWNASAVKPGNLPWDNKASPDIYDHTWTNFGDYNDWVQNFTES
ncbi:arylsulfatase J-like [Prorops nasuta]|uniref:arylsulfatase J-like n=1 Tax=Prorops nasuta TaxID=863751 RepID=UPI0034CF3CCB